MFPPNCVKRMSVGENKVEAICDGAWFAKSHWCMFCQFMAYLQHHKQGVSRWYILVQDVWVAPAPELELDSPLLRKAPACSFMPWESYSCTVDWTRLWDQHGINTPTLSKATSVSCMQYSPGYSHPPIVVLRIGWPQASSTRLLSGV